MNKETKMIEEDLKECLLCLRIPHEKLVSYAKELWEDEAVAQIVAERAAKLIRRAYLMDSPEMCGKSPKGLAAGALYLAGWIEGQMMTSGGRITQGMIRKVTGVTETTIRNRYIHLMNVLGLTREDIPIYASYEKGAAKRRETNRQKKEIVKNASKWARQILVPGKQYQVSEVLTLLIEKAQQEGLTRVTWWSTLPQFKIINVLEDKELIKFQDRKDERSLYHYELLIASSLCTGKKKRRVRRERREPKILWFDIGKMGSVMRT